MRFLITKEQVRFFKDNQMIEFEHLFTKEKVDYFKSLAQCDSKGAFRDAFRKNHKIKSLFTSNVYKELVLSLINATKVRLAFDLLIKPSNFFNKEITLMNLSSVSPILLGLIICISSKSNSDEDGFHLPIIPGNGLFFSSLDPFSFKNCHKDDLYFLIGFSSTAATYSFDKDHFDPYYLKNLGYVVGETLKDPLHPRL